jgi:hypothetical protein
MEKTIKIKIANKGKVKGTVGWLADHAAEIKIGESESGRQGAWLKDKDGNIITVLVIRGYWDNEKHKLDFAVRRENNSQDGYELVADCFFSDAAWKKIEATQKIVALQMDELWEAEAEAEDEVEAEEIN